MKFQGITALFSGSIRKVSSGLFLVKMIRALGSIALLILMARSFGSDVNRDAYVLALGWGTILGMVLYGPVNEVVRAEFIHQKHRVGESKALSSFRSLVAMMMGCGVLGVLVLALLVHFRLLNLTPGYDAGAWEIFARMALLTLPLVILNQLASVWSSLLNAYGFYFYPDIFGLISTLLQIVLMLVFKETWGILSLVVAAYVAALAYILSLVIQLHRSTPYRKTRLRFWDSGAWTYFKLGFPFYASYAVAQGASALERLTLTKIGVGAASNLDYARKFSDFPTGVMMAVIGSILVPRFAELGSRGQFVQLKSQFMKFFWTTFGAMSVLAAFLVIFAEPLLGILLRSDRFSPEDLAAVIQALKIGALGLPGVLMYTLSGQTWVAIRKPGYFAMAGSVSAILGITLALSSYQRMGPSAFLLGWSVSHWIGGIFLFGALILRRKSP